MDVWTAVLLLALSGFSLLAYSMRVLDAAGSVASFVLGLAIVFLGGLEWLLLMAVFTGIAFVATHTGREQKAALGLAEARGGERSVANVVGNGLAPMLMAFAAPAIPEAALVAFVAAVAAITADTLGSEIGALSPKARRITPPFPRRPAGENGAVSLLGQAASLAGATAIGTAAVILAGVSWQGALVATVAGFIGGQIDSLLGATVERDARRRDRPLGKQQVNFLASVIPAAVVLLYFATAAA